MKLQSTASMRRPSIFLEPPSGLNAEQFSTIFDEIASANKVCRFDRLGMGDSDPAPEGLNQAVRYYSHELSLLVG